MSTMYTTDTLLAELDYRRDRIKDGARHEGQHRRFRTPFVRRPASTVNDARQTAR